MNHDMHILMLDINKKSLSEWGDVNDKFYDRNVKKKEKKKKIKYF